MDFLDIASRYAQNRFDQATQPFTDPNAYMENRLGFGGETEEERRKRLERERMEAERQRALIGNTEVQTQQVKTYADGSQEQTTTQQIPAPVAPVAPPMVQQPPMVQEQQAPVQQPSPIAAPMMPEPVQQAPVQQAPAPQAVAPAMAAPGQLSPDHQAAINKVMPPAGAAPAMTPAMAPPAPAARPIINDQGQVLGQETPQQMVQGAQTSAPVAPTTMPQAAPAQMMPAAAPVAAAPTPIEQMGPSTQFMDQEGWQGRITTAKTAQDYRKIMADPNTPEEISQLAAGKYAETLSMKREEDKASKIIDAAAQGDPKATNDLARAIKSNKEEGSYIKAILFSRLGLNELAKEEQQKLGAGSQFQSIIGPDGSRYTAEVTGQGAVISAYDTEGRAVDNRTLAQLGAQGITSKGATVHTGMLRDRTTGEIYYQRVQGGQTQLVSPKGQVFSGDTKNLYAYGIGSDLETKNAIQLQTLRNDLLNKPKIEAAQDLAKFNAINGTNFSYDQVINAQPAFQVGAPGQAPSAANQATSAGDQARAAGIPVISGTRSNDEQWALYDAWVASGRKGNPVARPGTSKHETGNAIDVKTNKLTPENRTWLKDNGFTQPLPEKDPNHWERQTPKGGEIKVISSTPAGGGTIQGASPADVETQRKRLEKSQSKIGEAEGEVGAKEVKNQYFADTTYSLIKPINQAIKESTGSYIGAGVDTLASAIGKSTNGAQAIAKLDVLGYSLVSNVPRFEGPQGVRDVELYERAAGDLANSKKPIQTRLAALDAVITLLKKYDKAGNNDWSFGEGKQGGGFKVLERKKVNQ